MKKYQDIKNFRLIDAPVNRGKTQSEINIGAFFFGIGRRAGLV